MDEQKANRLMFAAFTIICAVNGNVQQEDGSYFMDGISPSSQLPEGGDLLYCFSRTLEAK